MEISDYTLISVKDGEKLIEQVKSGIRRGWQPIGGVCTTVMPSPEGYDVMYSQSMVRYEREQ